MNKIVAVLLSTYNGQIFLKDQINSILVQQDVLVKLLIRDDSSTDNTLNILKDFSGNYTNVHYYVGDNVGAAKSFLNLSNNAPEVFCDQDDILGASDII